MKKIALGIAALAVATLTLSGCALGMLAKPSPPAVVNQGTPVNVRGMSVNVTDLYSMLSIGDGFSAQEAHNGVWLVIKLHVQNDSDRELHFDATEQTLIQGDAHGRRYSADSFASSDLGKTSTSLNPGLADDVVVAYDVPTPPRDTTGFHHQGYAVLELKLDFMGPPVYIRLMGTSGNTGGSPTSSTPTAPPCIGLPSECGYRR